MPWEMKKGGSSGVRDACENYHKLPKRARRGAAAVVWLSAHEHSSGLCGKEHPRAPIRWWSGHGSGYFHVMAGTARDTKLWQEAIGLASDVIRVVRRATRRETKAFTDALMLSATAVASAVAEAPTRANASDERDCYVRARRALVAVETQLAIARVSGIIPSSVHAQLG